MIWWLPLAVVMLLAQQILAQQEGAQEEIAANPLPVWVPLGLALLFAYLILILPEQRKRKKQDSFLANLKTHDRVVTIGGILGTVANIAPGSDKITLTIDEKTNTRIRILRSSVARLQDDDTETNEQDLKK